MAMTCPKCGFDDVHGDPNGECPRCGVIYRKAWSAPPGAAAGPATSPRRAAPPEPVVKAPAAATGGRAATAGTPAPTPKPATPASPAAPEPFVCESVPERSPWRVAALVALIAVVAGGGFIALRPASTPAWEPRFGDPQKSFEIGQMYTNAVGAERDYARAAELFEDAARQGHAGAQTAWGLALATGRGTAVDKLEAAQWFKKAARQNHAAGQYHLAVSYDAGNGVAANEPEAIRWYEAAAIQGVADAQYELSRFVAAGRGIERDPDRAIALLRGAAEGGVSKAQLDLAELYRQGGGSLDPDAIEAYKWASLASRFETRKADHLMKRLRRQLTVGQIDEANRRAGVWKRAHGSG